MTSQQADQLVLKAADALVTTPPVELAAALRSNGLVVAADHIRYLGVAVALRQATSLEGDSSTASITPFPS